MGTNSTRARHRWKEVILGANAVEIQAEERNCLLLETSHSRGLGVITGDHTEVVREDGGLSRLVRVKVVDNRATRDELKGTVRMLEVHLREPVRRLVLLNAA